MVVSIVRSVAAAVLIAATLVTSGQAADEATLGPEITRLVELLDRGTPSERSAAERELVELGLAPGNSETLLKLLPMPNDDMSQEAATRLARIRGQVQTRMAEQAVAETRVTLDVTDALLADVLKEIEKQTGNRVVDYREQFGEEAPEKKLTLKIDDQPFWAAMDQILDATEMSPYPFAEDEAMALVARQQGGLPRVGVATYAGPFRIEPTRVSANRSVRTPDQSALEVDLEISWEPRLRPVTLSQAGADLVVRSDTDEEVATTAMGDAFNIEVPAGSHNAEVSAPLELPSRDAKKIASLKGRLNALVPGRLVDMRFESLAGARDATQEVGGVKVTLSRVAQNQALWEIHMRIHVGSIDEGAAAAAGGWVFQNVTYLQNKAGEKIDHAGFETTMQSEDEVGFAYFFELPEGANIADYTWVYRTPAAIVSLPTDFEVKDIPLP
jgi:hypothetical protein